MSTFALAAPARVLTAHNNWSQPGRVDARVTSVNLLLSMRGLSQDVDSSDASLARFDTRTRARAVRRLATATWGAPHRPWGSAPGDLAGLGDRTGGDSPWTAAQSSPVEACVVLAVVRGRPEPRNTHRISNRGQARHGSV